jgi:hypothetical protein
MSSFYVEKMYQFFSLKCTYRQMGLGSFGERSDYFIFMRRPNDFGDSHPPPELLTTSFLFIGSLKVYLREIFVVLTG